MRTEFSVPGGRGPARWAFNRAMARSDAHSAVWSLVREQHDAITRDQLRDFGFSDDAIDHRIETRRLHLVFPGVYAVGRPGLTREGYWMAAVLSCGPDAALSHESAGALFWIRPDHGGPIEVSTPHDISRRRDGIKVHRRKVKLELGTCDRIPVTSPVETIIDLAPRLSRDEIEQMVNDADKYDLVDPETLRHALDARAPRRGVAKLRTILDRDTFTFTDSTLERYFLPIARRAGLPQPQTQRYLNSYRVDFFWPELNLVVETDSLRHHRTPAQQARDHRRDQAHLAAGRTPLRFTHGQIRYEPRYVEEVLRAVVSHLNGKASRP
jgi:very-short-patch-repair endonuclease